MSFTIVKFFYILFTTVKAFYQRQIPSVTTAIGMYVLLNWSMVAGYEEYYPGEF